MKPSSKFRISFFSACLFICCLNSVNAKHMGLSSLTYTHISGNLYHFQFIYYRDCSGITPQQNVALNISSYSCGINQNANMPVTGQGELITPVCSSVNTICDGGSEWGIEKWIYEADVNIPGQCPDWAFSVSYYRNPYFTNVQVPYSDAYAEARLDNSMHDNSSPVISNEVIMFLCIDQDFHFNNGFVDPDGDSLSIAMVSPMMTENTNIHYKAGFDSWNPVSSYPPVSFDQSSGDLFIHPTQQEISIMSFQVNEFRNGEIIGRITRDIGFYTITCNDDPPKLSGVNGTTKYFTSATPGTQLCFDVFSADNDQSDSVFISWDHGISAATFISDSAKHPAGTFCWTPAISDIRPGPYYFTVTVRDNWCPMNSVQTYSYAIYVTDDPSPLAMHTNELGRNGSMIYPNPTSGTLHFSFYQDIDAIRIYDHAGKLLISDNIHTLSYELDKPSGIYLVEILFNDGRTLKQSIFKK